MKKKKQKLATIVAFNDKIKRIFSFNERCGNIKSFAK